MFLSCGKNLISISLQLYYMETTFFTKNVQLAPFFSCRNHNNIMIPCVEKETREDNRNTAEFGWYPAV